MAEQTPNLLEEQQLDGTSSFDDIELGSSEVLPLRSGQERQLSDTSPSFLSRGLWQEQGGSRSTPADQPDSAGVGVFEVGSQFIEFSVPHQQTTQSAAGEGKRKGRGVSSSGLSFNLLASSGVGTAAGSTMLTPRTVSARTKALLLQPAEHAHADMFGAAAAAAETGSYSVDATAVAPHSHGRFPLSLLITTPAHRLITAPISVPMGSVLFSIASAILALTFFVLFIAHQGAAAPGCTLLLTAASASAGPAMLTLRDVQDPATIVCTGREEQEPLVMQDSLAALLTAHLAAVHDARAQLSFAPAGGSGSGGASIRRNGVALKVEEVTYDAVAGTVVVQVDDWDAGKETIDVKFGVQIGQPLLVFRIHND